jgi:hypothetical protein
LDEKVVMGKKKKKKRKKKEEEDFPLKKLHKNKQINKKGGRLNHMTLFFKKKIRILRSF